MQSSSSSSFNISISIAGDFGLAKTLKADDLTSSVIFFFLFLFFLVWKRHLLLSVLKPCMKNRITYYLTLLCLVMLTSLSVLRIFVLYRHPRLWEHQITCAQSCLQTFLMDSSPIYGLLVTLSNLYSDVWKNSCQMPIFDKYVIVQDVVCMRWLLIDLLSRLLWVLVGFLYCYKSLELASI